MAFVVSYKYNTQKAKTIFNALPCSHDSGSKPSIWGGPGFDWVCAQTFQRHMPLKLSGQKDLGSQGVLNHPPIQFWKKKDLLYQS